MSKEASDKTAALVAEEQGSSGAGAPPMELSASEKEILDRQLNGLSEERRAPSLWSYTTTWDKILIVISIAAAIIAGALNPLLTVSHTPPDSSQRKQNANKTRPPAGTIWSDCRFV